jgi:protein arginine N-methyltransferase 1
MLPDQVTTFLVPVSSPHAHAQIQQRKCKAISEIYDLGKLLARLDITDPFDIYYDVVLPETSYLSAPRVAKVFDFTAGLPEASYQITLRFAATTGGLLTGFKGYFIADLTDEVQLDISGADMAKRTASDSWKHSYLPIREPVRVEQGDTIALTLNRLPQPNQASPFAFRYQWQATIESRAGVAPLREELGAGTTVEG